MSINQPLVQQLRRPGARNALAALCVAPVAASPMHAFAKKGQSKWPTVVGEVTQVDPAKQAFSVKDTDGKETRFAADPTTEIEVERERPVKYSWPGSFTDVKTGTWVRVKYIGTGEIKSARDIDVYINAR